MMCRLMFLANWILRASESTAAEAAAAAAEAAAAGAAAAAAAVSSCPNHDTVLMKIFFTKRKRSSN